MKLLIKREQSRLFNRPIFHLSVHVELTQEEGGLIQNYHMENAVLWDGDNRRALKRAAIYAIPLLFTGSWFLHFLGLGMSGVPAQIIAAIVPYLVAMYFIFHWVRDEVRVRDLIYGRSFKARSVPRLMVQEDELRTMTGFFRDLLEIMKNWNTIEVHEIEPGAAPQLKLIERRNAAA